MVDSEGMQRAANSMNQAAESFARSMQNLNYKVSRMQRAMDEFISQLKEIEDERRRNKEG